MKFCSLHTSKTIKEELNYPILVKGNQKRGISYRSSKAKFRRSSAAFSYIYETRRQQAGSKLREASSCPHPCSLIPGARPQQAQPRKFSSTQVKACSFAMGSKGGAPTWADQWGSGDDNGSRSNGKAAAAADKKTVAGNVKAAASEGFVKAKAAALVGAHKVKTGTSTGIKWVKDQYQKRTSK